MITYGIICNDCFDLFAINFKKNSQKRKREVLAESEGSKSKGCRVSL